MSDSALSDLWLVFPDLRRPPKILHAPSHVPSPPIDGARLVLLRVIDKAGQALMQERLVVSGAPTMEARHVIALSLRTVNGMTLVTPVLVRQSNPKQRVTFDRETRARARKRCKEIGCTAKIAADAARGEASPPESGNGPLLTSDDSVLDRLIASASRSRRR